MQPLFSVITVCFNEQATIRFTMDSVLRQTFHGYEYIVKDGGSTDATNSIIEEYRHLFEEQNIIFKHISGHDRGTYDAMNIAARECSGRYCVFLNAGDLFYRADVLDKAAAVIQAGSIDRDADVYYGDGIMEDNLGKALFRADMSLIDHRMAFVHQAGMVKRETFMKHLYDVRYPICADYNFFLTLYDEGALFSPLNIIVCVFNANGVSSTAFVRKRREHEKILTAHGRNKWYRHLKNMAEAYVKQALNFLPDKWIYQLKYWYKWNVKHYEKWDEPK